MTNGMIDRETIDFMILLMIKHLSIMRELIGTIREVSPIEGVPRLDIIDAKTKEVINIYSHYLRVKGPGDLIIFKNYLIGENDERRTDIT